jgi:hypothetical protein
MRNALALRRGVLFAVAWSTMLGGTMLTGMTAEQPMIHSAHSWRSWKNISEVSVVSGLRKECCTEAADVVLTRRIGEEASCNEISQPVFKLVIERVFFSSVFEA